MVFIPITVPITFVCLKAFSIIIAFHGMHFNLFIYLFIHSANISHVFLRDRHSSRQWTHNVNMRSDN